MRMLIVGKSQSGKTTLATKVVDFMLPQVNKVFVICPTFNMQPTWKGVKDKIDTDQVYTSGEMYTNAYEKIKANVMANYKDQRTMLIIDDVSAEGSLNRGGKGDLAWLVYNAVWVNLTIICVAHKLSSITPALRENLEHLVVFTLLNPQEVKKLADEINITGDRQLMYTLYATAVIEPTKGGDPHSFLYVKQTSPPEFYRTFEFRINV